MFRIDKSTVKYQGPGPSGVVIKQWQQTPAATETASAVPDAARQEEEAAAKAALDESLRQQAEAVLKKAQEEADALIASANIQVGQIKDSAWQDGYQRGLEEAKTEEARLQRAYKQAFDAFLLQLQASCDERDAALSHAVATLALEIAEKIVGLALEKDDAVFIGFVREAIERLNAKDKFTIHVNQREYSRFFAEGTGWLEESMQCAPFTVVSDPSIAPGGLTVRAQSGMVEAGVDTRLGKVRSALNNG